MVRRAIPVAYSLVLDAAVENESRDAGEADSVVIATPSVTRITDITCNVAYLEIELIARFPDPQVRDSLSSSNKPSKYNAHNQSSTPKDDMNTHGDMISKCRIIYNGDQIK